jgi:hypothetical protein
MSFDRTTCSSVVAPHADTSRSVPNCRTRSRAIIGTCVASESVTQIAGVGRSDKLQNSSSSVRFRPRCELVLRDGVTGKRRYASIRRTFEASQSTCNGFKDQRTPSAHVTTSGDKRIISACARRSLSLSSAYSLRATAKAPFARSTTLQLARRTRVRCHRPMRQSWTRTTPMPGPSSMRRCWTRAPTSTPSAHPDTTRAFSKSRLGLLGSSTPALFAMTARSGASETAMALCLSKPPQRRGDDSHSGTGTSAPSTRPADFGAGETTITANSGRGRPQLR